MGLPAWLSCQLTTGWVGAVAQRSEGEVARAT